MSTGPHSRRVLSAADVSVQPLRARSLRDEVVCMAVLADARKEIGTKLREHGFVEPTSFPIQESRGAIAMGDLGPLAERVVPALSQVNPRIWAHATRHTEGERMRERSREVYMHEGVRAAFSTIQTRSPATVRLDVVTGGGGVIEVPDSAAHRNFLYSTGSVAALLSVFERIVSAWQKADFNPNGITADLELAIEFLRSPDAVRSFSGR